MQTNEFGGRNDERVDQIQLASNELKDKVRINKLETLLKTYKINGNSSGS